MNILLIISLIAQPSVHAISETASSGKTISNVEPTPQTVRIGIEIKQASQATVAESGGLYCRVDDAGSGEQRHCLYLEVNGTDEAEAAAIKVMNNGASDGVFVAAFNTGPALETASFYNGSRGFISTMQWEGSNTSARDFGNSANFIALWGDDGTGGSQTPANYGMYLAQRSLGNSFRTQLQDPTKTGWAWGRAEFSISIFDYTRSPWTVYNTGQMTFDSYTASSAGAPLQVAPITEWRGEYYNGGSPVDKDFQLQMSMDGSGNPIMYFQMGTNGAETNTAIMYHDGDITFSGGVEPGNATSDPCAGMSAGSLFYNSTSGFMCYCNNASADLKVSDDSACF